MDIKNNAYSYQYDELTSEESSEKFKLAESVSTKPELKQQQPEFKQLMAQRKNETLDFKNLTITLALLVISIGLVANLTFGLLVACRKRKRQTTTTLVMFSMCCAYFVYLCFYCLKISVYFSGDNITKFHMYDTIDNWIYGAFLCKVISGLPFFCKLVSRLSILTLVVKRLVGVFVCDCSNQTESKESSQVDSDDIDSENTKLNEIVPKKSEQKTKICCQKLHLFKQIFEWPFVILIVVFTWILSVGVTFPIFNSYKLNEPTSNSIHSATNICNSVFRFPEDITLVSRIHFSYMIYGLVVPACLTAFFLICLSVLQSSYCSRLIRSSDSCLSANKQGSTTSSSSSFDDIQTSRYYQNNLLLWFMFILHLMTSLPQEIYRYYQLNMDFNDEHILDNYLTASLIQPILKARPYYAFQLLYISEFTLMPIMFILFFVCSMKRTRPTRSESDSDLPHKPRLMLCTESVWFKYLRSIFYDPELSKFKESYFFASNSATKKTPILLINDDKNQGNDVCVANALYNRENLLINNQSNNFPIVTTKRTAPFEVVNDSSYGNNNNNGNLVHIIQHPSWRINIKQQASNEEYNATSSPFNYIKSNGFKN